MTDILYILGHGADKIDNAPLRWSLRSLAKHATNVGRVIVAGNIPSWLSDEVVKVPIDEDELSRGKSWRLLWAQIEAVKMLNLDKPLLFSSDDHYLCKDVDLDEWPHYFNARKFHDMQSYIKENKELPGIYPLSLVKTRRALANSGLPHARRYALHLNTWIDPTLVDEVEAFANRYENVSRFGLEAQCVWGAHWEKHHPDTKWTSYSFDGKVKSAKDALRKIKRNLPGFTTSPSSESKIEFQKWMNDYYSGVSKWEKADEVVVQNNQEE